MLVGSLIFIAIIINRALENRLMCNGILVVVRADLHEIAQSICLQWKLKTDIVFFLVPLSCFQLCILTMSGLARDVSLLLRFIIRETTLDNLSVLGKQVLG